MRLDPLFPDLRRKFWAKPDSPEPHRLVTDIDAPLGQQIFEATAMSQEYGTIDEICEQELTHSESDHNDC